MGIVRYLRDVPPAHYLLKIESFAKLVNTHLQKYESTLFEAGGYKWRLSVYPKGNTSGDGAGYVSLYLRIVETESFEPDWSVNVFFKMFVLDQNQNKYLTIEEDDPEHKTWRFDSINTERGFGKLISQVDFKDPSKGHLVNDECIFGVEVFTDTFTGKGESLSITTVDFRYNAYEWQIADFSGKDDTRLWSDEFTIGEHKWQASMDPNGFLDGKGKNLMLSLKLLESAELPYGRKVYTEYQFTVKNEHGAIKDAVKKDKKWFSTVDNYWGINDFMPLARLNNASKGFITRDTVTVEVKIPVISVVKDFA